VARARAPLDGDALTAAQVEAARARAGELPQLHLAERSRLGLDGSYSLELEAGASVPVWAPEAAADRRLTAERLAATRRQLRAERRAELHDTLLDAVALLATEARLRALDALAAALRAAGPRPAVDPPLRVVDVQLLATGRSGQRRRAEALRQALTAALGVRIPPDGDAPPGATPPGAEPPRAKPPRAARDPLGFGAAQLEPARCLAANDSVTLARLAQADTALSQALAQARARPHADLDLGGSVRLGSDAQLPAYTLRLGMSVRLPPWSEATGAASLTMGAAGVEQSLSASWPNRAPAAPPGAAGAPGGDTQGGHTPGGHTPGGHTPGGDTPGGDAPGGDAPGPAGASAPGAFEPGSAAIADAQRSVERQWTLLVGQEADLLARRRILLAALAEPRPATLSSAYQAATLALQLTDTDEALGVTRLDAALLCGALPP